MNLDPSTVWLAGSNAHFLIPWRRHVLMKRSDSSLRTLFLILGFLIICGAVMLSGRVYWLKRLSGLNFSTLPMHQLP